ncbi:MAG: hypothetical protein AB1753_04900, partial [Thermoproteota archaeon]
QGRQAVQVAPGAQATTTTSSLPIDVVNNVHTVFDSCVICSTKPELLLKVIFTAGVVLAA